MDYVKRVDFFRKIPEDLTVPTLSGGWISFIAALVMTSLFFSELSRFMEVTTSHEVVFDESQEEMIDINFNITMRSLPCQFTSVDVSDMLRTHKLNVTSHQRKTRIVELVNGELENHGVVEDHIEHDYGEAGHEGHNANEKLALEVTGHNFDKVMAENEGKLVLVNFYSPWCIHCQRLEPTWEHTAGVVATKDYGDLVVVAKMNCMEPANQPKCIEKHIKAFPTIRVFHHKSDEISNGGAHTHEQYQGPRTPEAFLNFIEAALAAKKITHPEVHEIVPLDPKMLETVPNLPEGCNVAGVVRVRKVPGNFHIVAHSSSYTFDHSLNASHIIHHLSFGPKLSDKELKLLPSSEATAVNLLSDTSFSSGHANTTLEHYIKVVGTKFSLIGHPDINTYKYTSNNNEYSDAEELPSAKFTFDLSAVQIIVSESQMAFSHFLTSVCAIIGGVFTVMGLIDSGVYHGARAIKEKMQLGKLT